MISTDHHIVNVNTNDAQNLVSGNSNDFEYNLNIQDGESYEYVMVLAAEIPKSYYIIDDPFNTFTLVEDAVDITVTISEGNYDQFTWMTAVADGLTNASLNGITYTTEYVEQTDKMIITSDNVILAISIKAGPYLFKHLGFFKNTTNVFVGGVLTSTRVIELSANPNIYLHSNMPLTNLDDNSLLEIIQTTQVLPFGYISMKNTNLDLARKVSITQNSGSIYRFYFTTDEPDLQHTFRPIDFNGADLSFTLIFFNRTNMDTTLRDTNKILLSSANPLTD